MNETRKGAPLLEHEADGIKELDNLLPRWWVWLFYLSTIFAIAYMFYYHVLSLGDLQIAAYKKDAQKGEQIKNAAIASFESSLGTLSPVQDTPSLDKGQVVYTQMCAPCHRADGGGLVGPNLCDDYWIHGSNYIDNLKVIINGVPEKGMLTWRGVLKPAEIQAVASYIYAFRGTSPANPKPPENQKQPEVANQYE
jgi:cytochrome c oxidase cbb3-type subunit III